MAIQLKTIDLVMRSRGYLVTNETKKKRCFQRGNGTHIYMNLASTSGKTALVLHPQVESVEELRRIPELSIGDTYYHASNMTRFPKRLWRGKKEIPYGWGVTIDSETALRELLDAIE